MSFNSVLIIKEKLQRAEIFPENSINLHQKRKAGHNKVKQKLVITLIIRGHFFQKNIFPFQSRK